MEAGVNADRELLVLAAKAAGYEVNFDEPVNEWYPHGYDEDGDVDEWWNPLKDDGDALRLAVKLNLSMVFGANYVIVDGSQTPTVNNSNDPMLAVRRAIVCAAAEIGRAMP